MTKKNQHTKIDKESILRNFEWPEFSCDRIRIKAYSNRYKDMSVTEAFEACYNVTLNPHSETVNIIPQDLRVGDYIKTRILSVDKSRVVFDSVNSKKELNSSVNLYKYEKFRHYLPLDEVDALVRRVDKDKVVIDPIFPMVENWMTPILKNPNIQRVIPTETAKPQPILVKDLQLTKGGFMGKAVIPTASEFVGEDYTVSAFIPGSQIVLNIAEDFEAFNGKSVWAFVVNYMQRPGSKEMTLVCSAKEYIKFIGECNLITLFNSWCEDGDLWKSSAQTNYEGKVTGVINTSKKCGVFVEIPSLSVTGMVQTKPEELVNYKPHQLVAVKIAGFDEDTFYDTFIKQVQHALPYEIEDGRLKKCNIKPVLQFA